MKPSHSGLICLLALLVSVGCTDTVFGSSFEDDLKTLKQMRNGRKTPFEAVEARGRELLDKYPTDKHQGLLYYELSHIHAQAGLVHPDRVIEYAKKALELPIVPMLRMRLFVYCGDAMQVNQAIGSRTERQKQAMVPYLSGLAELESMELPETSPELPASLPMFFDITDSEEMDRLQAEQEKKMREIQRIKHLQEFCFYRDVLIKQTASLYRHPAGLADELETAMKAAGIGKDYANRIRQNIKEFSAANPARPPR